MELGNFIGKLKGQEKEEPKVFLALVLTDEVVQAAVWKVQHEQTEIIAIGSPVEWDGETGTTTELVTASDATISSALEGVDLDPDQVILGIPESWSDKEGILGVKREFIKVICKELELKPLGFAAITDAIISYLKMQEGTPTTSIMIQVARDELTLVLIRLGRTEAVEVIGRGDDIAKDVVEGITRFKLADNLPSRIILFNSMHGLDDLVQNLVSYDWQSEFNFLHFPKIEALPKDVVIRATALAGGSEVAKSLGFVISEEPVKEEHKETVDSPPPQEQVFLSANEIGFSASPEEVVPKEQKLASPKITLPAFKLPSFKFKLKLPELALPKIKGKGAMIGVGAVVLITFFIWLLYFLPSASLEVKLNPKILEQNVDLTLSSSASEINFADKTVPASVENISESSEKMIETTGTKTVGDPAVGEITIYNRTSSPKTFLKGTVLTASNLKFTLDQDVTVASKSAGADYIDVPGKSNVKITATAIGQDSNLGAGTEFTIQSFGKDSFVAKNDTGLTGGDSEEVRVVSKDDQEKLASELTEEILEKIKNNLGGGDNSGVGIYLVPDSAEIVSETYSAKIGETATTLTGKITLKSTLLRYKTDDVATLVNSEIDQEVPADFVRAGLPSTVELSASAVDDDQTTVQGNAKVKVALLPVLDEESLKNNLKGKNLEEIEGVLTTAIPGYSSVVAEINPKFIPPRFNSLPKLASRIKLILTPISP